MLAVCTAVLFGIAANVYQRTIRNVTLTSNSFLTTEWHLLQELKAKTDRQLYEKDLEIARLRAEYLDLKNRDFSPDALHEIETKLRKAEEERAVILSLKLTNISQTPDAPVNSADDTQMVVHDAKSDETAYLIRSDISAPITELLGKKIQTLEAEVAVWRLRAEMAERQAKESTKEPGPTASTASMTPMSARIATVVVPDGRAQMILDLVEAKEKEIAREPPPKIDDIKTRALLRAIVSSPEIKKDYPELLVDLDRYFTVYGRQEWLTGQKDAYAFISESIKALESAPHYGAETNSTGIEE